MTIYLDKIISVSAHDDDETAFAVAEDSFSAADVQLAGKPTVTIDQEAIANPTQLQTVSPALAPYLGLKNKSKIVLPVALRGTGTAAANAVAALGYANRVEGQLLRNAFGGESLGTGSTISDESIAVTTFDAASAAGMARGQAVAISIGGVLEANVIGAISSNTMTFIRAFTAAPENAAVINASATYYIVPGEVGHSLQFRVMDATGDSWDLLGCQLDPKISLVAGQLPIITFDGMVASWAVGAVAVAVDSYDNSALPPVLGYAGAAYYQTFGTTTSATVDFSSITVEPGLGFEAKGSPNGVQGVGSWVMSSAAPVVEIVVPYSDTYRDEWEARTAKYLHYQIGTTAGQTLLIELQKAYHAKKPEIVVVGGIKSHKLTLMGVANTAEATDLLRSPLRIHLL